MREQNEECKTSFTENCKSSKISRELPRARLQFIWSCMRFATNHFCEISAERKLTLNAVVSWLVVCGRASCRLMTCNLHHTVDFSLSPIFFYANDKRESENCPLIMWLSINNLFSSCCVGGGRVHINFNNLLTICKVKCVWEICKMRKSMDIYKGSFLNYIMFFIIICDTNKKNLLHIQKVFLA
jgi:hypothetical protein